MRSKTWNIFARSNSGIVGSNPPRGVNICQHFFYFVFFCVGIGFAMGLSPSQWVLPTVYMMHSTRVILMETGQRWRIRLLENQTGQLRYFRDERSEDRFLKLFIRNRICHRAYSRRTLISMETTDEIRVNSSLIIKFYFCTSHATWLVKNCINKCRCYFLWQYAEPSQ